MIDRRRRWSVAGVVGGVAAGAALLACASQVALAQDAASFASNSQQVGEQLPPGDPMLDGEQRPVTRIELAYVRENDGHPAIERLLDTSVQLAIVNGAWAPPHPGLQAQSVRLSQMGVAGPTAVYDSALPLISQAIVTRLKNFDANTRLLGVYAEPDPSQIRVENEEVVDGRPAGQSALRFLITTGRVTGVRTIGVGERVPQDDSVNNPMHIKVRRQSPVQPAEVAKRPGLTSAKDPTDLLETTRIDDFVFRLNRHPGRRVDVAVAATGEEPGAATLDYIVTENRPWLVYAEAMRDGSRSTDEWRYRFGFLHHQLTGNDDSLSVQYQTSFDNVNQFAASYERPVPDTEDRWKGRVYGSFYDYTSDDVGQLGLRFEGEGWNVGAEAVWNFYQNADLFIDAIGGAKVDYVKVDNQLAAIEGEDTFVIGYVGARLEQRREDFDLFASAMLEIPINGASEEAQNNLGRLDADERWVLLKGEGGYSFYLEPLLASMRDRVSLQHEIALVGRGQATAGQRLVPNYQDVLGGLYSVRGYPQGIAAGDYSLNVQAEYRFHLPRGFGASEQPGSFFGEPFRWAPQYAGGPTDWDLLFRGFVDAGMTVNADKESFEEDQTLLGAGLGAEFSIYRRLVVRSDFGWALAELENADGSTLVESGDFQWHFVATLMY
jgi:hemolysin activation/secretion protein